MRRQGNPASTSKPPAGDSMYVALPELPLERTLSRKFFLFLVGGIDQQPVGVLEMLARPKAAQALFLSSSPWTIRRFS